MHPSVVLEAIDHRGRRNDVSDTALEGLAKDLRTPRRSHRRKKGPLPAALRSPTGSGVVQVSYRTGIHARISCRAQRLSPALFSASPAVSVSRIVCIARTRRNDRPDHSQTQLHCKQCKARGPTTQALMSRRRRAKHSPPWESSRLHLPWKKGVESGFEPKQTAILLAPQEARGTAKPSTSTSGEKSRAELTEQGVL